MPLSEWKNGKTFTANGHDLLLPFDNLQEQYQARHYFFLQIAIYAGGISRKEVERSFKYQLWEGDQIVFEQEYTFTVQVVWYADVLFGAPAISFVTYIVTKERFRTTIINGVPTAEVDVVNKPTLSGQILDYNGKPLTEDEIGELENPSWSHTLAGTRTGEFGTVILDTTASVGQSIAYLEGRIEMPVYRQTVRATTEVDIVFDSLGGTGRTDRYQFRGREGDETFDISATRDIHGGVMGTALLDKGKHTHLLYERGGGVWESRGFVSDLQSPIILATKHGIFKLIGIIREEVSPNKFKTHLNEYISKNGGQTFYKSQTISSEGITMPQAVIINDETGETGLVMFEGTELVFRSSRDYYSSKNIIRDFKTPEPMALTAHKGILRAVNFKGTVLENRDGGFGPWDDRSTGIGAIFK